MNELSSLSRTVKGIAFPYPVMIAGGIVKTAEHVKRLAPTDAIPEWGSFTTLESAGNGGRDYHAEYHPDNSSILLYTQNSLGLPNPGMKYAEQHARDLIKLYDDLGKPLTINVSGNGVEDALTLLKRALMCGFRVVTLNGACPNKAGHPILCDDRDAVDELFERVDTEIGEVNAVVFWKVSAGMRRPALAHNRTWVNKSKVFTGSITCNTVPNGFDYADDGSTVIKTGNGINRGGLAGPAILPIALDHTEFMASDLAPGKISVGCGGIGDAKTVRKFFRAGATLVQMNSAFREANEQPSFITAILEEMVRIEDED